MPASVPLFLLNLNTEDLKIILSSKVKKRICFLYDTSYSDHFNFKNTFLLASIVLNIKMFLIINHIPLSTTKNVIIVFMVKTLHLCLFHSASVFTLRVSSLLPTPLELIGLGKHPKQQYLDSWGRAL